MKVKIGEKIKELRKQNNITQEQLAEVLGVTNQTISKWESENGYPDIEYIIPIADFFKVTTDYLFDHSTSLIDDIDLPFVDDENILGKWVSIKWIKNLVDNIDDFMPPMPSDELYYQSVEFLPDGELRSVMKDNLINAKWTKGLTLIDIGNGNTASAYEIRNFNDKEYLFIEWKNGDYTYRRAKPSYYIFMRDV